MFRPTTLPKRLLELTSEITEDLGKLSNVNDLERLPRLRRVNRIKSIQSSLAIENNTLSLEQVTDVLNGKRVLGPQDDILARKKRICRSIKCFPLSIRFLWTI